MELMKTTGNDHTVFDTTLMGRIDAIDLSMVAKKLSHSTGNGWSSERTDVAVREYRRFLYLCGTMTCAAPTHEIDEVWHAHILDSIAYQKDCAHVFGRFMHHRPYLRLTDPESLKEMITRTRGAYAAVFGDDVAYSRPCADSSCKNGCDNGGCCQGSSYPCWLAPR